MHWLNGELVSDAKIEASSAGVTLGWGVFRTLGVAEGEPRFFDRHFARLCEDASAAHLDFPFPSADVLNAVREVIAANAVQNGLARLTLTQRSDGRWNTRIGTDFSILALETPEITAAVRVQLSPYRVEAKRPLAGVKITSYLPSFWAWREAQANGFDEAILCDGNDFLSEGARSTLVWAKDGALWMPSLETGALRGVGRDLVEKWAASSGLTLYEGRFAARDAETADEVWLVSAASGARAVTGWHDEIGSLVCEFSRETPLQREFLAWWQQTD